MPRTQDKNEFPTPSQTHPYTRDPTPPLLYLTSASPASHLAPSPFSNAVPLILPPGQDVEHSLIMQRTGPWALKPLTQLIYLFFNGLSIFPQMMRTSGAEKPPALDYSTTRGFYVKSGYKCFEPFEQ